MIKSIQCVVIACDTCGDGYEADGGDVHFPTVAEAITWIGPSEESVAGQQIDTWLIGEDGSATCDYCRQRAREEACPAHEWDDETYPFQYCRLCHAWRRLAEAEDGD